MRADWSFNGQTLHACDAGRRHCSMSRFRPAATWGSWWPRSRRRSCCQQPRVVLGERSWVPPCARHPPPCDGRGCARARCAPGMASAVVCRGRWGAALTAATPAHPQPQTLRRGGDGGSCGGALFPACTQRPQHEKKRQHQKLVLMRYDPRGARGPLHLSTSNKIDEDYKKHQSVDGCGKILRPRMRRIT